MFSYIASNKILTHQIDKTMLNSGTDDFLQVELTRKQFHMYNIGSEWRSGHAVDYDSHSHLFNS